MFAEPQGEARLLVDVVPNADEVASKRKARYKIWI